MGDNMFQGFSGQTVDFLWGLRFNNNKPWFLAHKAEYETHLLTPMRLLSAELQQWLGQQYGEGSWNLHISRIYRDARRLYGRGPMKDHLWFTLFRAEKEHRHPAFYFSFEPEGCCYGMGFWDATADVMERHRQRLLTAPQTFVPLAQRFAAQERLVLDAPAYVRRKADVGELLQPWFDLRRIGVSRLQVPLELSFSRALLEEMQEDFAFLMPYFRYLESIAD